MKRYLLFCGYKYYPNGGILDLKKSFDTVEEYNDYIEILKDEYDWIHVYDCLKEYIVFRYSIYD